MSGGGGSRGSTSTSTSTPDPTAQRLNTLYANELEAAKAATGGTSSFLQPNPLATPTEGERGLLSRIAQFPDRPLINPYEMGGLDAWRSATDPTLRLGAASQNLTDVAGPALTNASIAGGFGARSGALLESLSRAGKEMALPISMDVAQAQRGLGTQLLALGPQLESRELERLYTALGATEAPRLAALQESLRPQQLYYSQLLGTPITSGSTQSTVSRNKAPGTNFLTDVFVPLAAAGLIGWCWIAEAVYGPLAMETGYARHYLVFGAPEWFRKVYVKLALQLSCGVTSRHRLIARIAMERGKLALGVR